MNPRAIGVRKDSFVKTNLFRTSVYVPAENSAGILVRKFLLITQLQMVTYFELVSTYIVQPR